MSFLQKHREGILYIFFGALTTLVNFVLFFLFQWILGEHLYLLSNLIAWAGAVVFAFIVNKLFVFESRSFDGRLLLREGVEFAMARVFSLIVEELGLLLLLEIVGVGALELPFGIVLSGELIVKVILAVIVLVMNYFFSKLVIFKKKSK